VNERKPDMKKVVTVTGEIKPEELGFTDMHEHILMKGRIFREQFKEEHPGFKETVGEDEKNTLENIGIIRRNNMFTWDTQDLDDPAVMEKEVADFRAAGGRSLVEMSVPGIRGDIRAVKTIAQNTGVNVIGTTGIYIYESWPEWCHEAEIKDFMNFMKQEIEEGIEGTGIRPGMIKVGISSGFRPREELLLRAAARTANETGLSLTVHPCFTMGGGPLEIAKILKEENVDMERTVIAHMGAFLGEGSLKTLITNQKSWGISLDYLHRVLDTGVNICIEICNTSDREATGSTSIPGWMRLAAVYQLIQEEYAAQLVLATDTCAKHMARYYGGEGYGRLTRFAIPTLRDIVGVSPYAINQIMVKNPARILAY